jgi:NAD-dependent dihydropyrimidine dehydrogenase PreA subunit
MSFVITDACVDVLDKSCTEECPVDCIYEGDRKMYINPVECIDCGACEQVCPMSAAVSLATAAESDSAWNIQDNADFFGALLNGTEGSPGTPGGASHLGRVGADTPRVARLPRRPG